VLQDFGIGREQNRNRMERRVSEVSISGDGDVCDTNIYSKPKCVEATMEEMQTTEGRKSDRSEDNRGRDDRDEGWEGTDGRFHCSSATGQPDRLCPEERQEEQTWW